jgi:hypothetical protein
LFAWTEPDFQEVPGASGGGLLHRCTLDFRTARLGVTTAGMQSSLSRCAAPHLPHVLEPWLYMNRGNWSGFFDDDVRRWERRFLD